MEGSGLTETLFRLSKLLSNEVQSGFFSREEREGGREDGRGKWENEKERIEKGLWVLFANA